MKIGFILGIKETTEQISGVNRATRASIGELMHQFPENEYYSLCDNYLQLPLKESEYYKIDIKNEYDYMGMGLIEECDIIHSFYNPYDYMFNKVKKVLTIHDLIPMRHPEWFNDGVGEFFNKRVRKAAEMSSAIITPSYATKQDVIELYGIDSSKIHVVSWGVEPTIDYEKSDKTIFERFDLTEGYVLSVCTIEPRKNLRRSISAFIQYKKRSESRVKLAICGKMGWDKEFEKFYESLGEHRKDVIRLGYVSDAELSALYKNAIAFVYNSFYEGFGLPVLEAMKCGKAVLTSNASSIPEVGGDAVCYCNPYDEDSIAEGFAKIIDDNGYRSALEKNALIQASKFSFKQTAQDIIKVYEHVLGL